MRIVIIGNGVAGMEAALAVREREPGWDITIVSEESDHFFSRTALMYVLSGQMSQRDIEPLERDVYARAGLGRVRARATSVDFGERVVRLAGGLDPVPYDRLLIACGSRPRPGPWKGSSLRGVGHFVTMQDLEWLENEVHGGPSRGGPAPRANEHLAHTTDDSPYVRREAAATKRGRTARAGAVIGGGLIGIECVETFLAAKMKVSFFVREDWFWPIAVDANEAAWIADALRAHGVDVHLGHEVDELEGDEGGNLIAVKTTNGSRVEADVAVVAIGVVPNTAWLAASPIDRDTGSGGPESPSDAPQRRSTMLVRDRAGGIIVDAGLSTSVKDVFAAGDCASVLWFDGQRRPEQLWYTARDQGRVAARRLCGDEASYARGTFYNSAKLMDIEYTTAGLVNFELAGEQSWYFEEKGPLRSTSRIIVRDERVVGFNFLGRRWDQEVLVRWIHERRALAYVIDHLSEASFDTEFVPPLVVPADARRLG